MLHLEANRDLEADFLVEERLEEDFLVEERHLEADRDIVPHHLMLHLGMLIRIMNHYKVIYPR